MHRPLLCRLLPVLWARAVQARGRCFSSWTSSYGQYSVVSLYHFNRAERVGEEVRDISGWLEEVGATRRVHFNSQGVNCQVCLESDKLMNKHVTSQPLTLNLCFLLRNGVNKSFCLERCYYCYCYYYWKIFDFQLAVE